MADHDPINISGDERVQRDLTDHLAVTFGCSAPRQMGGFRFEKVGFAGIPRLTVTVMCKREDAISLAATIRQAAFGHLGELGWSSDHAGRTANIAHGRTRMFIDDLSGSRKRGEECIFSFDLDAEITQAIDWRSRLSGKLDLRECEMPSCA